jgi:hypothetical protein
LIDLNLSKSRFPLFSVTPALCARKTNRKKPISRVPGTAFQPSDLPSARP